MGVFSSGGMGFAIMALVLGIVFSPVGFGVSPNCTIASTSACALNFNGQATIVLSTSGYALYQNGYQTCQNVTGVNRIPLVGYLANLPILSNVFDFFAYVGQLVQNAAGNTNYNLTNYCLAQTGNLLAFHYNGQDLVFLLIGIVITSGAIAALTGISFVGTGSNPAGTYIVFMLSSLGLLWIVLSAFAYPTFIQMPTIIGGTIYTLLTLMYAYGIIELMG